MTIPTPDWPQRVRDARIDRDTSQARYEQTVRDAHDLGHMSAMGIAKALGIRSREQITRYLNADAPQDVPRPRLPFVVLLRAQGMPDTVMTQMYDGCAARGWFVTLDGEQGWHLARAGCPTIWTDISAGLLPERVDVRLVAARYPDTNGHRGDLESESWPDWKPLAGRRDYQRPIRHDDQTGQRVLDTEEVIRHIARVSGAIDTDAVS